MQSIIAIEAIAQTAEPIAPAMNLSAAKQPDFTAMLNSGINQLDQSIAGAEKSMNAFAVGEPIATHDLMLAMEKARFSMQVAVEVRNRLVEAYAELTRMQV